MHLLEGGHCGDSIHYLYVNPLGAERLTPKAAINIVITDRILKICKTISFPAQGVVVRKKETEKKLIFGVMPYAKVCSAKKNRKNEIIFAPVPPFLQECRICGRDAVCVPLLAPPPSLSHAPFCTFLCFQRMMNHDADVPQSR